jgi:2-iminobutanoate/2-iminopropanoate deaminase
MSYVVMSKDAPEPIGPYSQAVISDQLVFCSGQLGIDPRTGKMVEGGSAVEARRCLENLKAILEQAGTDLTKVLRCTIYLTDLMDFQAVNSVYAEYFPASPPARTSVQVAALPRGAKVEIDAIASLS